MDEQTTQICKYFEDGDCTYEEKCGEYAPKCKDVISIGRCHKGR